MGTGTELRLDSDAAWRAATHLDDVATELDTLHRVVATTFADIDGTPPAEVAALPPSIRDCREIATDLRRRATVAELQDEVAGQTVVRDRLGRMRQHLAHLDDVDGLLSRLPEADRNDDPWAALARMSTRSGVTVTTLLAQIDALLRRHPGDPWSLEGLVHLVRTVALPPITVNSDGPVRILVETAERAGADGILPPDVVDGLVGGIVTAITAAAGGPPGPAAVVDLLEAGPVRDGGLQDVVDLLPPSVAVGVIGALLEHNDGLVPDWLQGSDGALREVLERAITAAGAMSDVDLAALVRGLALVTPVVVAGERGLVRELLALLVARLWQPGFVFDPRAGQEGLVSFDELRAVVVLATDSQFAWEFVASAMTRAATAIASNRPHAELHQIGAFIGVVLDATQDHVADMLSTRSDRIQLATAIIGGMLPGLAGVGADAVGELADRAVGEDTLTVDGATTEDRAYHRLGDLLEAIGDEVATYTGDDVHRKNAASIRAGMANLVIEGGA